MFFGNQKKGSDKLPLIANNTTNKAVLLQRYDYIPIDYIKAQIIGLDTEHFLNNDKLVFECYKPKRPNKSSYLFNEFENIEIKIYETGSIYFSGSLHMFYNNGLHNHNEFNKGAYFETLERIKSIYGIEPDNIRIIQMEYGVNIFPPIPTNDILNNLIQHKNKDFEQKISNENGKYHQCEHANYIIKVYNKSLQYGCKDEVLRIEIKQTNWSENRKSGFKTLHDFNNWNKQQFVNNLLTKWNEIIFYDPTNTNIEKWGKYSNVNFWRELRGNSHTAQKKHADRLKQLNQIHGLNVQLLVNNEIVKMIHKLQGFRNFNLVENQRFCRLTGVNISMQRKDSFLLSHKGLNHLLEHDKRTFENIKKLYLSNLWKTSTIKTQIKEIAHNIRTKYNYRTKRYNGNQLTMFKTIGGLVILTLYIVVIP